MTPPTYELLKRCFTLKDDEWKERFRATNKKDKISVELAIVLNM